MERCDFASVTKIIRDDLLDGNFDNQTDFAETLFSSYLEENNVYFDIGLLNKWLNGLARLSPAIGQFYRRDAKNREALAITLEDAIIPSLSDSAMVTQQIYELLTHDPSISERKKQELCRRYPCETDTEEAAFMADVLIFGMVRPFQAHDIRKPNSAATTLSPIVRDYILGNEVPAPCAHFCGRDQELKELAFRIVRWKCWDSRYFSQPKLEAVKQMDFWLKLDSLSQANGEKKQYTDYMLELYEMRISDQQCRQALHGELTREESDSVWRIIHHTDSLNLNRLKELIAEYGFPTWEKVSYDYALCAWLVAQHADSAFLHNYVEQLKKAVADNNANPANLAYMIDRDLMNRNLPQLYGTQFIGVYNDEGVMENMLWPVENMEQLNARREHMLLAPMDTTGIKVYDENAMTR